MKNIEIVSYLDIRISVFSLSMHPQFGSIAQLVQSICLTSKGSQVRILLLPQLKTKALHESVGLF